MQLKQYPHGVYLGRYKPCSKLELKYPPKPKQNTTTKSRPCIDNSRDLFIPHNPPRYIINRKVKWSASHSLSIILLISRLLHWNLKQLSSLPEKLRSRRSPRPESQRLAGPQEIKVKTAESINKVTEIPLWFKILSVRDARKCVKTQNERNWETLVMFFIGMEESKGEAYKADPYRGAMM